MKAIDEPVWIDRGVVLAAFLVMASVSCTSCVAPTSSDHEDDHLEHHLPEHKPRDFGHAIDDLERRHAELSKSAGSRGDEWPHDFEEIVDIVRWLPEIAGDSDMPEADWNIVSEVSARLLSVLEPGRRAMRQRRTFDIEAIAEPWAEGLGRLRKVQSAAIESGLPDGMH